MSDLNLTSESLFSVKGQVAVITGGGTGIGLMIATTLEHNGAVVYIAGRRLDVLEKAAKDHSKHGNMHAVKCDVTSRDDLLALVRRIQSEQGHINLLVNNSGVLFNNATAPAATDSITEFQAKLWNAGTPEEFNRTWAVNVAAVYYTTVAFLALLDAGNRKAGKHGVTSQVLTMSSIGGFRRDERQFSMSYGASKAAATHLGKTLANVLKPWRIRSNIIAPGLYPSEMTETLMDAAQPVGKEVVPLERVGGIEDMGGLVVFLSSRAGAYVNGGVHITDGGRLGLFSSTY